MTSRRATLVRPAGMSTGDRDYVLGTGDIELERLGLQHRVWRPYVLDAWGRAGFGRGHALVDIGCGPGYATLDLAALIGPAGRVVAIDRSRRFLDALEAECRQASRGGGLRRSSEVGSRGSSSWGS